MGRISAVRYFDNVGSNDVEPYAMPDLLKAAEIRLKEWGYWLQKGNSLAELQVKSCMRPMRPGVVVDPDSSWADSVHKAITQRFTMPEFVLLTSVYVRRMSQNDAAQRMEVSRDKVKRTVHKAKLLVISECF